ncbi:uncharacterized protein LOC106160521 [Lingula anatina]|uniref:Uncharacterized protein LOC106160521 n=1 Tax=Lingula anatina TaxID=7574 RepID=A0A1S3I2V1_LINAN|nr:uncharacterized protein LOC106160521 [Lingula anatina]|eukprot:XP_013392595.1 uncharacterized protein LOC106160521 [Lingula anatina]
MGESVRTTDGTGYQYTDNFAVTDELKEQFYRDGFIILRKFLDTEEVTNLRKALEQDKTLEDNYYTRDDGDGYQAKTANWNHPVDDITGMIGRSEKAVGTMEKLLGGEVYQYHAKVIMKEPFTGGAFVWHQDYGYWYVYGNLFPDMATVWIAVDRADRTNGCLQILPGSHRAGRIEHVKVGDQAGAEPERVEFLAKVCPLTYVQLDPGDAVIFHCNLVHRSDQNHSQNRRWAYLVCYNRASNDPVYKHHYPNYTPLIKVQNSRIKECGTREPTEGKLFFQGPKRERDPAIEVLERKA